jgi:hypothetical protein
VVSNGKANFSNLILYTAGSYTLTAKDGGLISITSDAFTINVPTGLHLVFAASPRSAKVNTTINPPPVIYVEDSAGEIVRNYNSVVTLPVYSGPGKISGTLQIALSNGMATFSNVKLSKTGTYKLMAKSSTFGSVISSTFSVTT